MIKARPSISAPTTAISWISLGWAYYRIGQYEDAVEKSCERAITSTEDPTITTISATPIGAQSAAR